MREHVKECTGNGDFAGGLQSIDGRHSCNACATNFRQAQNVHKAGLWLTKTYTNWPRLRLCPVLCHIGSIIIQLELPGLQLEAHPSLLEERLLVH